MLLSPTELVAAAKAEITEASVEEFHEMADAQCLLIDLRDRDEYLAAHLPGAVCEPRGMLEFKIHGLVQAEMPVTDAPPADQPIVLYCGTGGRSALSAQSLQSMGYTNVRSIAGGIDAWKAAGLPLANRDG